VAVVEHLKTRLLSQGFALEGANNKEALFTLDRGLVAQQGNARIPTAHIVIELQFRFKQKADQLTVMGNEEVVGERGRPMEFRRPAISDRATCGTQSRRAAYLRLRLPGRSGHICRRRFILIVAAPARSLSAIR
jgi:hypothetical protein